MVHRINITRALTKPIIGTKFRKKCKNSQMLHIPDSQTGAATSTSASGSVDLLADFADVLGASSTTSVNPSATLEKSPNSGLYKLCTH